MPNPKLSNKRLVIKADVRILTDVKMEANKKTCLYLIRNSNKTNEHSNLQTV